MKRPLGLGLLVVALASSRAGGQGSHPPVRQDERCPLAVSILTTGSVPANFRSATGYPDSMHLAWAAGWSTHCGAEGGRALASAMRARSAFRDVALLERLTAASRSLRDGSVFRAAAQIAESRGASEQARVFAIRTLLWQIDPSRNVSYASLAGEGALVRRCADSYSLDAEVATGAPLPAGYRDEIAAIAMRLADASQPSRVRSAAVCLRLAAARAR